jgi:uncharacterized RDD family membrane protein YckC
MDLLADLIEEPKLAPIGYRMLASLIDSLILYLIGYVIGLFFGGANTDSFSVVLNGMPALLWFLIFLGLVWVQEGLTGKTIGKRALKIKVLKSDYSKGSIGSSIVRHLFDFVDMLLLLGLLVAALNKKKQRIGDLVGNTIVVVG